MKNDVIFHAEPPSVMELPSSSLSILKAFLKHNEINSDIKYWNFLFQTSMEQDEFRPYYEKEKVDSAILPTLPFLSLLALKYKDDKVIENIIYYLKSLRPEKIIADNSFYENYLNQRQKNVVNLFEEEFKKNDYREALLHGFSARFNQWIAGAVCAFFIKKHYPAVPIVIGGFDSKEEALSLMKMIDVFDFAVWGEGEYPLLHLCNELKNKTNKFENIPHLIYRQNNTILSNATEDNYKYLDLDTITPDYDDYFEAVNKHGFKKEKVLIPIENGRGCGWNKCKFCFLNAGYCYRLKNNEKIMSEIVYYSQKYKQYSFSFIGTDLIGFKYKNFELLLDALTDFVKNSEYEFNFTAEIIPKSISIEIIRKLSLLNFSIQIGYEAVSDTLLAKMNKCSRFADLLFFIKFAKRYGLKINGANILTDIPGEVENDVQKAIENLPFLRFFLGEQGFSHENRHPIIIKKGSIFYSELDNEQKKYWKGNPLLDYLPENIIDKLENRFSFFAFSSTNMCHDKLWDMFFMVNNYFEKNSYYYKILKLDEHKILYKEYCNGVLAKSLVLDNPLYIDILKEANRKIISIHSLMSALTEKHKELSEEKVITCLNQLKSEYLLYYNPEIAKSIISIIDITNL